MKFLRTLNVILLLLTSLSALIAGMMFMLEPSGKSMGITPAELVHGPLNNFFIPGLILFMVNGVMNMIAAILLMVKPAAVSRLLMLQGILLSGWILVEFMMIQSTSWLQLFFGAVGIFFFISGIRLGKKARTVARS